MTTCRHCGIAITPHCEPGCWAGPNGETYCPDNPNDDDHVPKEGHMAESKYTVVQHSGVTTGHTEFAKGLEPKGLAPNQLDKVAKAGGLIFNSYTEADDYAEAQMYPPGYNGMTPRAPGTFSDVEIGGLKIYLPKA